MHPIVIALCIISATCIGIICFVARPTMSDNRFVWRGWIASSVILIVATGMLPMFTFGVIK